MAKKKENKIKVYVHCEKYYDGLRNPLYLFGDFGVEVANGHSIAGHKVHSSTDLIL